jgi:hypothetical protein
MSSKDYGPFEDLAGDAPSDKDNGFGPFDDLAKASAPAPAPAAKAQAPRLNQAKTLSLGGMAESAKGALNMVGSLFQGGSTGEAIDDSGSDPMGSGLGQAITSTAAPATPSLGEQLQRPAPANLPITPDDARGNAAWDSMAPQAQERVRQNQVIQARRNAAPDLKAAPDRGMLPRVLDTTNRKPLDNSLGGAALETAGDAARGAVRGIEGISGAAWSGIRAASDLTAGPDSDLSSVAANAAEASSDAQRSIAAKDPNSLTQQIFESTFANVPIMLGFGTGARALGAMGGMSAAQSYNEARNQGKAPDEAAERALWHGTAEILGERLSLPVIGDLFAKAAGKASTKELGLLLSELLIKEQVGEQATTALQAAYDKAGRGGTRPDMTLSDYLDDVVNTAKVTLGQSLLMGGGAGIVKGVAQAAERKPAPAMDPFELAKSKGFLTTPPTTEDTPTVMRDRFAGMFRDLGAHFGLPKRAVERAIEAADGKPATELGGFFKRIAAAYESKGLFGAKVDPDVLGVFDGPVQVSTEDATGLADEPATEAQGADTGAGDVTAGAQAPAALRPIDEAANMAATSPANDLPEPTQAQKDAGNYTKGHGKFAGLDLSIENPRGSKRSGVDSDGAKWETTMAHHYGYIKGTVGADKDHVDVFVGQSLDESRAFVIDQVDPKTGKFDEHKVVLGADSIEQAQEIYRANYAKGWKGMGAITELPMDTFKTWVKDGKKRKPLGDISHVGKAINAQKAAARAKARLSLDPENDTMLQALAKMGGIRRDSVAGEFGLKPEELAHTVQAGSLKAYPFRKKGGMDLDTALESLAEAGYFDGVPEDERRATFEAAIYDEMGGAPRLTSVGAMRKAEADYNDRQAQYQQEQQQLDAESQAEADAEREAIMAEAGLSPEELSALSDDRIPDVATAPTVNTPEAVRSFMRDMGFTEQEIADEIATEFPGEASLGQAGQAASSQAQAPDGSGGAKARPAGGSGRDARGSRADAQRDQAGQSEGLTLQAQTPEDLKAKTEREEAATSAEKAKKAADQERLRREAEARDDKARADSTVDDFQLGQSADQQMSGMGDMFAPESEKAKPIPSANTIFTEDAAAAARARLKAKLGRAQSGIDPEMLMDGLTLAGYHIEKGARSFAAYARAMVDDLGEGAKPYLKSWYMGVKYDPRAAAFDGMSSAGEVESTDLDTIADNAAEKEDSNVPSARNDLEPDRQDPAGSKRVLAQPDGNEPGQADAGAGKAGKRSGGQGGGRSGDSGVSAGGAPAARDGGDQPVRGSTSKSGPSLVPAGADLDQRGGGFGDRGIPVETVSADATRGASQDGLAQGLSNRAQRTAPTAVKLGDTANIRETLPLLLPGQQEDVQKAETRFAKPDGYGMLFTNGTGTGKTFTGLGVVKRFALQGKTNTIMVVPSDKIMEDWISSGKRLGLDITPLASTKDAGRGVVITTYANFGDNRVLGDREWDLVVHDEAHYLMQAEDGKPTAALATLRAITKHPDGAYTLHSMRNRVDIDRLKQINTMLKDIEDNGKTSAAYRQEVAAHKAELEADRNKLNTKVNAAQDAIKAEVEEAQGASRPRATFLSATPFAYVPTVDWANGYLMEYDEGRGDESNTFRGYNEGSNREQFFMQHFGMRMRYNKLTKPDAKVNTSLMERQFNTWLRTSGALSGRMLDVHADYDRRFVLVESAIGLRIDEALNWVYDQAHGDKEAGREPHRGFDTLGDVLRKKFDYLSRRYLLEAIKAQESIAHVKAHMAMGRKVVVFHDYKKGGGFNPFDIQSMSEGGDDSVSAEKVALANEAISMFRREFRDLVRYPFAAMPSPIEAYQQAFPGVLLFNGDVKPADRRANVAKFQDDATGPTVILVQSAAGKEGISLHDTTGKHQRALLNLGQPTQPTTAIQQEGRIYRTGQKTDAIFRYFNTGTNWEKWAFATTISTRSSTAENLGMGELARALKDAFIAAFEESDAYPAGHEGEGKGGKERDKAANEALTEFDRAVSFYYGTQKKNSKTKAAEGADYFATPEPLGLKMVEWLDSHAGDHLLEPSGGHGAIARWMPENTERTVIEPSSTLRPRLAMVFDGKIIGSDFEDLHISNKFDGIVMNPPFGMGGKLAVEHLAKAAGHLREGGRIVALIPTGPAADKRFDKWFYEEEAKPAKALIDHPELGKIYRGDTITIKAFGAQSEMVVHNIDTPTKGGASYARPKGADLSSAINLNAVTQVKPTGKRTETFHPAEGLHLVADIKLPQVTFERAGTSVATRIVVIEKPAEGQRAPEQRTRDWTGIDDINDFFARIRDADLPKRAKPVPAEGEASADPGADVAQAVKQDGRQAAKAQKAEQAQQGTALAEGKGWPIIEHTTGKGKVLKGVVRKDLSQAQAKEFDAYTFKKDGGWFIRAEHVPKMVDASSEGGPNFSIAIDDTPPFYSELARRVDKSPMAQGLPAAWLQYLDALAKRGAIKADEVEWTGLRDWLGLQQGKVKREQVAEFVRANGVQVQEVMLGNPGDIVARMNRVLEGTGWEADHGDEAVYFTDGEDGYDLDELPDDIKAIVEPMASEIVNPTKFGDYAIPGGENYRELLLKLPAGKTVTKQVEATKGPFEARESAGKWYIVDRNGEWGEQGFSTREQAEAAFPSPVLVQNKVIDGPDYRSKHWEEPNVLAHVRIDDRTDADGKRVLFVQEVQSDWGQEGKKKGFANTFPNEVLQAAIKGGMSEAQARTDINRLMKDPLGDDGTSTHDNWSRLIKATNGSGIDLNEVFHDRRESGVPSAPFVTKTDAWVSLAIKRIIKMAADGGYDRVAFITGQQAADQFDLSKQISRVEYTDKGVLIATDLEGKEALRQEVPEDKVEDYIGKEAARKLLDATPQRDPGRGDINAKTRRIDGDGLKVGGEGMRTFYDQIVPKVAKDVLKKVGGDGLTKMDLSSTHVDLSGEKQNAFDITPAMREKAAGGLPLFSSDTRPSLASLGIVPIGGAVDGSVRSSVPGKLDTVDALDERAIGKVNLERIARDLQDGWRGVTGGQIIAVDTWRDLPQKIVQDALTKRFNLSGIEGVEFQGKVYLVGAAIKSREQAERVVFHEVYGHLGLKGALGGSPEARLTELWSNMNGLAGVAKLAKKYEAQAGKTVWDRLQPYIKQTEGKPADVRRSTIMNELIAFLAQGNDTSALTQFKGYLSDLKAEVVKLLRKLNLITLATKLDRTGTELDVLALVRDARNAIISGKTAKGEPFRFVTGGAPMGAAQAFSKQEDDASNFSIQPDDDLTKAMRKAGLKQPKGLVQSVRDYVTEKTRDAIEMIQQRNTLAADAFLNFRQGALDQFTGIDNAIRRDVGNLPHEQDPYIAARLANGGTSAVMRGLLMHGKAKWANNGQHLEKIDGSKGLLQILEPLGDDVNNWFGWMVGNRAARLMNEGRENNFTAEEIAALQDLAGPPGSPKRALFNKVGVQYADFKRSVLDVAQGAGLIDAEARKVWDHADYIPFYRQIDERAAFSPTGRKGLAGQSSGIRTLKGGTSALNDPMENLLMNFSRLIDASLKNNALRKTVDVLTAADSEAISKVGYDMKAAIVPRSQIEKALEQSGVPEQIMAIFPPELFDGMAKMWAIQQPADKDVIRVMRGGKPEFYKVHDPLLLRAATSFVPLDFRGLAAARWFKRVLTQTITSTPEFMARNFIRDSLASQMISRDRFNPAAALKGIKDSYKGTGASEAMLFAGASFQSGNVDSADPTATARAMRRALRKRGMDASSINSFLGSVVDKGLLGWERYRELGEAVENANREAAYKASSTAQKSPTTAAYEAKDLMDFNLRGSSPLYQVMADTLPFFNARIQGLYRLGRADPKRLARYGMVMMAASLALAAVNAGEDWYEELPDWDKDTYWHIKIAGQHFRIPKPFELGVVFATLPERLLVRTFMGLDSGNKTLSRLWANVRDQLAMDVVPQMIRPGLNVWANKDTFRDSPIETPTDEGKLPSLRYDGRTSATMKALTAAAPGVADALGASPKRLEYLVNGYFGTVGSYALGLSDLAVRSMSDAPPSAALRADDLPVVKSFYRLDPARGTVYESDLYNMREEVDTIYRSVNALRKEGDDERADAKEADDIDKLAAREVITTATKRLAELNKRRNAIYADRDMTRAEKRQALDEIQVERNEVAKNAMTNDAVKAANR